MLRFLGAVFLALLVVGWATHVKGTAWAPLLVYGGCAALVALAVLFIIRRHW